ncbi:hypothetical protein ACFSSA_13970 [Luteolibacter algae]|uniref:Uncharacterized protein n=1 Tax=Luteolibacter algae TaxID=454151 RepID=A0ABW5DB48_9BACT
MEAVYKLANFSSPRLSGSGARMLVLYAVICSAGFSQTADVFKTDKMMEGDGTPVSKMNNLPPPGPVDTQPSRFAGQDVDPYIRARAAVFSMRNRATDPFGLFQDPNSAPKINKMANLPQRRPSALPPTPLADIIKMIRVTTIMPGEKKFLVGTRSFKEDEEFPLRFQGSEMRMKVMEVTTQKIVFRNLDTGETAALETEMLPPGMVAGGDKMQPPGMVSPVENMPLDLGVDQSFNPRN